MSVQTHTNISALYSLTEADRLEARDIARQNVIRRAGHKPERRQFEHHAASQYPRYVVTLVTLIMLALLVAAFVPSAMRLYRIASDTFGHAINSGGAKQAAGLAFILLAESGQIGFTLAAGVLAIERVSERRLLYSAAIISTLIALVGNVELALGASWWHVVVQPFATLEAIAPPVLVIIAATVLKHLMLESVRQRHANERAYQQALADWQAATADPEASPHWRSAYTNALRQKLVEVNSRGRGKSERQAIMQHMTLADWRALVMRELQADNWFDAPESESVTHQDALQAVLSTGGGKTAVPLAEAPAGAILMSGNGHGGGRH